MSSSESKVKSKLILAKNLNFNHEKLQKIELFVNEVLNYNKKYNLISKNSEKDIWHRHVLDSAKLIKHIDSKKFNSLYDIGTGAGFPGIMLSIFYSDILTFHVKLYEKSKVKVDFIKSILQKLKLKKTYIYDNDYQSVISFLNSKTSKFLVSIFLIFSYFFSALSISEVFEDYIRDENIKNAANKALNLFAIIFPLFTIIILFNLS